MRHLALFATVAIIAAACGSRAGDVTASASANPPAATASAGPSPSEKTVAFPDLSFIVGTNSGDLFFQLVAGQPAGRKVHACDGVISDLVAYGRQALFLCRAAPAPTLVLYDDESGALRPIAKTEIAKFAFTGTGEVVYVTVGRTEPSAPISMTKLLVLDLRTGVSTTVDERYGVAFELRLSGEGVMVWRPKNSLSFVRPDAEAGTWILHGSSLTKVSQLRLIDGGKGRDLLESEPIDPGTGYFTSSSCCTYVVWKTLAEQRLTPSDVRNEKGLALLMDGRVVTWRPEDGEFTGSVVIYDGMKVVRVDRGRLGAFRVLQSGDWIVAQETAPTPALHAYRVGDGAFATMPGNGFSSLALLGPKK